MWLFIGICVAVIAGLGLLINLIPRRFFDAPLCTAKVAGPPPPLKTTSLRDANEIAFVQQTHKYLAFRLRTIMIRFNREARLLTPGALKNAGIDPEKMKIVIELSETIIHERNNDDFTKAIEYLSEELRKLFVNLAEIADDTYVRYAAVAGTLAPLIGPAWAIMVAYLSFAIVARQEEESVALRRSLSDIANLIESGVISHFEIAFETIQNNFQTGHSDNVSVRMSQINLNEAMRQWLHHFEACIGEAPSPITARWLGWFGRKRTFAFDKYIAARLAPIARYLLIGIGSDFMLAEELGCIPGFLNTLLQHASCLKDARDALRTRMAYAGIQDETTSIAASIAEWLDERCLYLDSLSEKLVGMPTCPISAIPAKLTFERRVRYLVLRGGVAIRRARQENLHALRVRVRWWRRYTVHPRRDRGRAR